MAKERIESILVSTAYEIAVAALAPEARPGDEYFEKLIKDSKEPEITIDFEEIDRLESRVHRLFVDALAGRRMLVYHRLNGEWKEAGDPENWRTAGFGVPGALSLTDESSTCGSDGKLDAYVNRAEFEKWLAAELLTNAPILKPPQGGRKHKIPIDFIEETVFHQMEQNNEFSPDDPDWNCLADLGRAVNKKIEESYGADRKLKKTALNTNIGTALAKWRSEKAGN